MKMTNKEISRVNSAENLEQLKEAVIDLFTKSYEDSSILKRIDDIEYRLKNASADVEI